MTKSSEFHGAGPRSLHQVVSEDGVMSTRRIFRIIKRLCVEITRLREKGCFNPPLRPYNVFIDEGDEVSVRVETDDVRSDPIYDVGRLMLFMATGEEKKSLLDTMATQPELKVLIERCTCINKSERYQHVSEISKYIELNHPLLKKSLLALFVLGLLCLFTLVSLHFYTEGEGYGQTKGRNSAYTMGYAEGYDKGYLDAANIGLLDTALNPLYGNLTANINIGRGAFAARSEDEVFYLKQGGIYRMNPYTSETKPVLKEVGARNLNYYNGALYYDRGTQIFKYDLKSEKEEIFCRDKSGLLYIIEGEFYLDDTKEGGYLYKIDPGTGDVRQLNNLTDISCFHVLDRRIYFSDPKRDFSLYSCDLDGGNLRLVSSNSCKWFSIYDHKIYAYAAGSLLRFNTDGGGMEKLSSTHSSYINVTEAGIFHVSGESRTLRWLSFDGRMSYRIVPSRTGAFNVVGRWIFYVNKEDEDRLWRVRIDGSDNLSLGYISEID